MPNRLSRETSPYLRSHAENPVDWYPWGKEALSRAVQENKPIFLSIGYSSCHWCHVMAEESFSDAEVAAVLNAAFIPVKVDREERPDLDSVYMRACVAMNGSGGWPMTLLLTPSQKPFFAATYLPKDNRNRQIGLLREQTLHLLLCGEYYEEMEDVLRKLNISLRLEEGAKFRVELQCDAEETWRNAFTCDSALTGSFTLPVRLPRCSSYRLRLSGEGGCVIDSVARIYEKTGDAGPGCWKGGIIG
jgi:uncharacterized protein YyaL (SSP411 family)